MSIHVNEGFTVLYNPSTGDPWACPDAAVDDWTAKGWRKSAPSTKSAAPAAKESKSND